MAEQKITIGAVDWRALLPFTHVFRAFRIAIHPTKLILAVAAILLMYLGGRGLDLVWPQRFIQQGFEQRSTLLERLYTTKPTPPPFAAFLHEQMTNVNSGVASMLRLDMGFGLNLGLGAWTYRFVVATPLAYWQANQVYFTLLFGWFLIVMALFGGAITRIAAVQVARDEQVSMRHALRFAWGKLPSFFGAPLIPLALIALIGMLMSLVGLLLYLPAGLGPLVIGALLIVFFAVGVFLAMLIVGAVIGSSMMFPTIAVEASDAFDATSRAYSYVIGAPWRLLIYSIIATVYGAITYLFVKLFVFLVLATSRFFLCWWLFGNARDRWDIIWPAPTMTSLAYSPNWAFLQGIEPAAAGVTCFWVYLFISLLGAYAISFYFSSNTIIYYLLRRHVDATEMDEVFMQVQDDDLVEVPEPDDPAALIPPQPHAPESRQPTATESTDPPMPPKSSAPQTPQGE